MKQITVTEMARNFSRTLTEIQFAAEEVVLVRNGRRVARLIPEAAEQDALAVFGDLYRTLDETTAQRWLSAIAKGRRSRRRGRLPELRNPSDTL